MTGKYTFSVWSFSTVKRMKKIIEGDKSILSHKNIYGKTLYLHLASRENNEGVLEFLKFLDENYPELRNVKATTGNDAYLAATAGGNLYVMKYLEKEFQWNVKSLNNNGNDAFMLAAYYGHIHIMQHLVVVHGWDIGVKNKYDCNALSYARQNKKQNVIDFLVDRNNVIGKVRLEISEYFSEQNKKIEELQKKVEDFQKQLQVVKELVQ